MIKREHYDAVLADLIKNRNILVSNLQEINGAITTLQRLYGEDKVVVKALTPVPATTPPSAPVEPALDPDPIKPPTTFDEAMDIVFREGAREQESLIGRIAEIFPIATITSIRAYVNAQLRNGTLHKGDDLKIRRVVDGKVVGLPPLGDDKSGLKTFPKY